MNDCPLEVTLRTLIASSSPLTASIWPQMTLLQSWRAPVSYALLNAFFSATLTTGGGAGGNGILGAFLVQSDRPALSVSQSVGIIASFVGQTLVAGSSYSDEKFIDFRDCGILLRAAQPLGLYAIWPNFASQLTISANLQLRETK